MLRFPLLAALTGAAMALGAVQSADTARAASCGAWCDPRHDAAAGLFAERLLHEAPEPAAPAAVPIAVPSPWSDPLAAPALATTPLEELSQGFAPSDTREFIRQVAMSDTLEVRASLIAAAWAADPEIRGLAREVILERRAARESLARLAENAEAATAARAFDARHAAQLTKLRLGPPGSLDQVYLDVLADSRAKARAYYALYAEAGEDADLRAFAARRLRALDGGLADAERDEDFRTG